MFSIGGGENVRKGDKGKRGKTGREKKGRGERSRALDGRPAKLCRIVDLDQTLNY